MVCLMVNMSHFLGTLNIITPGLKHLVMPLNMHNPLTMDLLHLNGLHLMALSPWVFNHCPLLGAYSFYVLYMICMITESHYPDLTYDWNADQADSSEIMEMWMDSSAWYSRDMSLLYGTDLDE